jgi:hypothetical protein
VRVRPIDTTLRRDLRRFLALPFHLYRNCPQWVPPLRADARLPLDRRRHPIYLHSEAAFFVVEADGETVGRLAVLDHRLYNHSHGTRTAFFNSFEATDDPEVAGLLFQTAAAWAARRGLDSLAGPKGFMFGDGIGLLVEGFEHRPALGIPYNHAYYSALVEGCGFVKETDFLSGTLRRTDHHLPEGFLAAAEAAAAAEGYRTRVFHSRGELRRWLPRFAAIYNQAFAANWEFSPLTDEEIAAVGRRFLPILDPSLVRLVVAGDEPVGYLIAYPDVSAALQRRGGRLLPLGWAGLLRERSRTRWANINGMGLLPSHRGTGANAVLYTALARSVADLRFDGAEVVQVEERNAPMISNLAAVGVPWHKRHRVYRRPL